jgi:acyl carrier protein
MSTDEIRSAVAEIAADVFGVDAAAVTTAPTLTALPTFNSFRIVEVVERVEESLGVEVDPAELIPDNLTRLDALTAMFARTLRTPSEV